jgi:hypothetical protein
MLQKRCLAYSSPAPDERRPVSIQGTPVRRGSGFGLAGWCGELGVSVEGSGYGVKSCQSVVSGGIEVAANAAPAGEGSRGVPVPGDGLMPFGGLDGLFGAVVQAGRQLRMVRVVSRRRPWCG